METENKDWKPEVGEKAWIVFGENVYEAIVSRKNESSYEQWYMSNSTDQKKHGFGWMDTRDIFPTAESAYNSFVSGIRVYDLEGKEVLIPRAKEEIAMLKTELVVANAIIDNLSPRLEAALEMILELQDEKEQWEFERGGAAIGGKSDQREGGC